MSHLLFVAALLVLSTVLRCSQFQATCCLLAPFLLRLLHLHLVVVSVRRGGLVGLPFVSTILVRYDHPISSNLCLGYCRNIGSVSS
jgi:hypothetical protein